MILKMLDNYEVNRGFTPGRACYTLRANLMFGVWGKSQDRSCRPREPGRRVSVTLGHMSEC